MNSVANPLQNKEKKPSAEVIELRGLVEKKEQQIDQLLDYIQLLRQKQFGASSERVSKDQINLFDEAELEQLLAELDEQSIETDDKTPSATQAQKKKPVRRPLPAELKRVERIIDLNDAEKQRMGDDWVQIGFEQSEQLAVIPRQYYVIVTKRTKYAPVNDSVAGAEQGIKVAARPDQIIPKSIAHSSVIADVMTSKFIDGLPFYRQEKIYARDGIDLSRQTMSGWAVQLEEKLSPLIQVMKKILYEGDVLHIDETRLQVLNEPNKENTQQSYMWVYKGGSEQSPVILYQYADNRSGQVPIDFLYSSEDYIESDVSVTLVTDGYTGYNALSKMPGIKLHAVCWAHARRKFIEASKDRKNTAATHQMVALISKLYQIERTIKNKTVDERKIIRQDQSSIILDKIKVWLDSKVNKVLPKRLLGKAINYTLNLWSPLCVYRDDGHTPIDNNAAENAIRPFVIGRKNWLFSGSPRGARASAVLYSLIETAKANELGPKAYLNQLFEQLPAAKTEQALIKLLPHNIEMSGLAG